MYSLFETTVTEAQYDEATKPSKLTAKQESILSEAASTIPAEGYALPTKLKTKPKGKKINFAGEEPKRRTRYVLNDLQAHAYSGWLDDIITGIISLEEVADTHKGSFLSVSQMQSIFAEEEMITVYNIRMITGLSRPQAQRYFNVLESIIFHAHRSLANPAIETYKAMLIANKPWEIQAITLKATMPKITYAEIASLTNMSVISIKKLMCKPETKEAITKVII